MTNQERQALLAISERQDAPTINAAKTAARKTLASTPTGQRQVELKAALSSLNKELALLNKQRRPLLDEAKPLKAALKVVNAELCQMAKESAARIEEQFTNQRLTAVNHNVLGIAIAEKDGLC